jgi:hypothetical protein
MREPFKAKAFVPTYVLLDNIKTSEFEDAELRRLIIISPTGARARSLSGCVEFTARLITELDCA